MIEDLQGLGGIRADKHRQTISCGTSMSLNMSRSQQVDATILAWHNAVVHLFLLQQKKVNESIAFTFFWFSPFSSLADTTQFLPKNESIAWQMHFDILVFEISCQLAYLYIKGLISIISTSVGLPIDNVVDRI